MRLRTMLWAAALGAMFAGNTWACLNPSRLHNGVAPAVRHASTGQSNNSVVGLWQVTYSVAGNFWDMSFDTWHSDGTENENTFDSPLISAVCWGVWETIGPRTMKLHHVGWNYDPSGTVLLGYFTFDQIDTLSQDGSSYSGTFTFQPRDLDGTPQGAPTQGAVSAVRIVVP